jgi:hypothetical protein
MPARRYRRLAEIRLPGAGPARYCRRAADPPHLTWCAAWARRAQVPLADNNARKPPHTLGTSLRNSLRAHLRSCDDDHSLIKRLVTNTNQTVISYTGRVLLGAVPRDASARLGLGAAAGGAAPGGAAAGGAASLTSPAQAHLKRIRPTGMM